MRLVASLFSSGFSRSQPPLGMIRSLFSFAAWPKAADGGRQAADGGLDAAAASGANARLDTVKLADFGWARRLPTGPTGMLTQDLYTLSYRCPEVLLGMNTYGPPSDVWAMGCVCVEMSEFRPAFPCASETGMLFKIFDTCGTPTAEEW